MRTVIDSIAVAWRAVPAPRRSAAAQQAAHQLMAQLASELSPGAEVTRECPVCGSHEHGRPMAGSVALSASYADGLVVVAAGLTGAIGIDVERGSPLDNADIAGVTLRDWTRFEAAAKAEGSGLLRDLSEATQTADTVILAGTVYRVAEVPIPGYTVALARPSLAGDACPE